MKRMGSHIPFLFVNIDVVFPQSNYYPGGMVMPERSFSSTNYDFGYQGSLKDDDIKGSGNSYTTLFRELDPRINQWWSIDPKTISYPWESPYLSMADNPILYTDIKGDDVDLGNLYDKNNKGEYKYPMEIASFELFAFSSEGQKYILDHAQKGFELKGILIKDLELNAEIEGSLSKKGIDVRFGVAELDNPMAGGQTTDNSPIVNERLKLNFSIQEADYSTFSYWKENRRKIILDGVDTWSHEVFLHGDLREQKYLDPQSNVEPYSHSLQSLYTSKYGNGYGVSIFQQAQSFNLKMNAGEIEYSADYIWYNIMMPGLGYQTTPKIKK